MHAKISCFTVSAPGVRNRLFLKLLEKVDCFTPKKFVSLSAASQPGIFSDSTFTHIPCMTNTQSVLGLFNNSLWVVL